MDGYFEMCIIGVVINEHHRPSYQCLFEEPIEEAVASVMACVTQSLSLDFMLYYAGILYL